MPVVIVAIAIIGGVVQVVREKDRTPARAAEILLLWWLVVAIGIGGILGAGFHIFDGPQIAEEIGFTRGDGGFQFENAMVDLALGVVGVLCFRFRGLFWLAAIIFVSIQYYGDAYGHFYQMIENDNHEPDNVGVPLYLDLIEPTVCWILYAIMKRGRGAEALEPRTA
jgi:hypothetical protein